MPLVNFSRADKPLFAVGIFKMENKQKELWKDVVGYENLYQVSNLGVVKSIKTSLKFIKNKIMTPQNRLGYLLTELHKNNKRKYISIHRIVAQAFIPNPENKPFVNHKNGIKSDNRVENLEWCTQQENVVHSWKNNLSKKRWGAAHHKSITTVMLGSNNNIVRTFEGMRDATRETGVCSSKISMAVKLNKKASGVRWRIIKDNCI